MYPLILFPMNSDQLFNNNNDQTCLSGSGFNISLGTQQMLTHRKPCLIPILKLLKILGVRENMAQNCDCIQLSLSIRCANCALILGLPAARTRSVTNLET